jgi:hypothetical protein
MIPSIPEKGAPAWGVLHVLNRLMSRQGTEPGRILVNFRQPGFSRL